jgi:hypothetical protein
MNNGTFFDAPYAKGDYYSVVPMFNILNAIISSVFSCDPMLTFTFMPPILTFISSLAIYAVMYRLSQSRILASLIVILSSSLPRGSSGQYIPSALSGSLGSLLVLLLILACLKKKRGLSAPVLITVFTASWVHPLGVVSVLLLSSGILTMASFFFRKSLSAMTISAVKWFFLTCLIISVTVWSSQAILLSGVTVPVKRLFDTLVSFGRAKSFYEIQYQGQGLELYAYPWAVPVSFSAAFLLLFLKNLLKRDPSREGLNHVFFSASAASGLILIVTGFASVISNPGVAVERYVSGATYSLLLFTTAFVFFLMVCGKKVVVALAITLLFINMVVGASSPDNAPFEHESFGAVRTTWESMIEARDIIVFLNSSVKVYSDHDIPVSYLMNQTNIQNQTYISFQAIRVKLDLFKNNSFLPFSPQYANSVFIIKTDEIQNAELFSNFVNTIYNSERHIMLIVPQS